MKRITCEMCGSTDIVKDDGWYVCQHCGTKYTVEEAKKLIVEGSIKIDKSDDAKNYLKMAESALEGGNGNQAYTYALSCLEIDPSNYKAWIVKMKSIAFACTIGNLMMPEVVVAGNNAIKYSDNKEETEKEVYTYYLERVLDLLQVTTNLMSDVASLKTSLNLLLISSPLTAHYTVSTTDNEVRILYANAEEEAFALTKEVPDEFLAANEDAAKLLIECAKQYKFSSEACKKRCKVYLVELLDSALDIRNAHIRNMRYRAAKALEGKNVEIPSIESLLIYKK